MWYIYVISSQARRYMYVGLTNNLRERLVTHRNGYNKTTKPYRPFRLIHFEKFSTRLEARKKEKYLKSGIGKEWIKKNCINFIEWRNLPAGRQVVDAHV